jgi:Ni/Co efflux regulator RcnB
MKKILAALVLASFLGAGLACAQGTDASAVKAEPTKQVTKTAKHHKTHKSHKKAAVKKAAATTPVADTTAPAAK